MNGIIKWGASVVVISGMLSLVDHLVGPFVQIGSVGMAISTSSMFVMTGVLVWLLADRE